MLRPLRDQIVIKPLERNASELVQVIHHEKPNLGIVVAVGPGSRNKKGQIVPIDLKVGDTVRYGTSAEYLSYPEYWEGRQRFLVLQEADICFVQEVNGSELQKVLQNFSASVN